LAAAFPELNAWERAGADASSAGMVDAGFENQKELTKMQQNQNEPQLRDENAHNDKSVHGVLNPTYQAGLRRDAVQPDIEAERKKRDEIEAGKSYCSRRFGGATCDDKSAQIYARFDKN